MGNSSHTHPIVAPPVDKQSLVKTLPPPLAVGNYYKFYFKKRFPMNVYPYVVGYQILVSGIFGCAHHSTTAQRLQLKMTMTMLLGQQECIPVGCIPSASVAAIGAGVCSSGLGDGGSGSGIHQKVIQEGHSEPEGHTPPYRDPHPYQDIDPPPVNRRT